jgi:hypothetical protein
MERDTFRRMVRGARCLPARSLKPLRRAIDELQPRVAESPRRDHDHSLFGLPFDQSDMPTTYTIGQARAMIAKFVVDGRFTKGEAWLFLRPWRIVGSPELLFNVQIASEFQMGRPRTAVLEQDLPETYKELWQDCQALGLEPSFASVGKRESQDMILTASTIRKGWIWRYIASGFGFRLRPRKPKA